MRYHYIITTQHTNSTGGFTASSASGPVEVTRGETEQEVFERILDWQRKQRGLQEGKFSVLFYRLVPDDGPGGTGL